MAITIKNSAGATYSWFCYNHLDALKLIALASKDIANGGSYEYDPPENADGLYAVRFTNQGGGNEHALGVVTLDGTIELLQENGLFSVHVT